MQLGYKMEAEYSQGLHGTKSPNLEQEIEVLLLLGSGRQQARLKSPHIPLLSRRNSQFQGLSKAQNKQQSFLCRVYQ